MHLDLMFKISALSQMVSLYLDWAQKPSKLNKTCTAQLIQKHNLIKYFIFMKKIMRKQGTESCNIHILLDFSYTREISKNKVCLCLGLHGFFYGEER